MRTMCILLRIFGLDGHSESIFTLLFRCGGIWERPTLKIFQLNTAFDRQELGRSERSNLEKKIDHLKVLVEGGRLDVFAEYKATLAALANIVNHEQNGLKVRSRVQWAEEGESSSSFFFKSVNNIIILIILINMSMEPLPFCLPFKNFILSSLQLQELISIYKISC